MCIDRGRWTPLLLVVLLLPACAPPLPAAERRWRYEREQAIDQAVPEEARASYAGLRFYSYEPRARVRAMLEPVEPPEPLRVAASNGQVREAHRVGRVRLTLPGGDAVLALYRLDDIADRYPDMLFLPFRDAGAGVETYAAGRYVEVERLAGGVVEIDFNRAYNPDCAYGISARCPITPDENTLPFPLKAGEMLPPGGH